MDVSTLATEYLWHRVNVWHVDSETLDREVPALNAVIRAATTVPQYAPDFRHSTRE